VELFAHLVGGVRATSALGPSDDGARRSHTDDAGETEELPDRRGLHPVRLALL
jgi:hypothetical protein